jgi:pimeloyl-ACP methyl ester carboxylesterase
MQTDFVQADTVKLQYFEHGTGPECLVLVHGYRSSGRIWRLVQEALDPTRFRSLALSNRGLATLSARLRKRITRWSRSPAISSPPRKRWACGILLCTYPALGVCCTVTLA